MEYAQNEDIQLVQFRWRLYPNIYLIASFSVEK